MTDATIETPEAPAEDESPSLIQTTIVVVATFAVTYGAMKGLEKLRDRRDRRAHEEFEAKKITEVPPTN